MTKFSTTAVNPSVPRPSRQRSILDPIFWVVGPSMSTARTPCAGYLWHPLARIGL